MIELLENTMNNLYYLIISTRVSKRYKCISIKSI